MISGGLFLVGVDLFLQLLYIDVVFSMNNLHDGQSLGEKQHKDNKKKLVNLKRQYVSL